MTDEIEQRIEKINKRVERHGLVYKPKHKYPESELERIKLSDYFGVSEEEYDKTFDKMKTILEMAMGRYDVWSEQGGCYHTDIVELLTSNIDNTEVLLAQLLNIVMTEMQEKARRMMAMTSMPGMEELLHRIGSSPEEKPPKFPESDGREVA